MKKIMIILVTLFSLIGCSQEQISQEHQIKSQHDSIDIDDITENTWLNLTQEEVKRTLGNSYLEILSAKDNKPMWRYDFGKALGYKFAEPYDFADIAGLQAGNISMQVFISWTSEQRVESIVAVYLNKDDGRVYEYRVFADGGERVQALTK